MKTLCLAACLMCAASLASCSSDASGSYTGTCENQTYGGSSEMSLILNERDNILSGSLTLSGELAGGSRIEGRRDGSTISFITISQAGQITWTGTTSEGEITGTYATELSPAYVQATGLSMSQHGVWRASKH